DAVVRNIRHQQVAAVTEPHRPLGPAQPGEDLLHAGAEQAQLEEALVEHFDARIGITRTGEEGNVAHDRRLAAPAIDWSTRTAPPGNNARSERHRICGFPFGMAP